MENRGRLYLNKFRKAQALLELAIFGSLLIMLLGVLISYGLRYYFTQQAAQEAFRKELAEAALSVHDHYPSETSYLYLRDKHTPNPADSLGVGVVSPYMSVGTVTRNSRLYETPDTPDELARARLDIQNQGFNCSDEMQGCTTAGFREESDVLESNLGRYKEIFGTIEGCTNYDEQTGICKCSEYNDDGTCKKDGWAYIDSDKVEKECVSWDYQEGAGEDDGEMIECPGNEGSTEDTQWCICYEFKIKKIRFIDYSAGQIMDYSGAQRQCRVLVDNAACEEECLKGVKADDEDGREACGKKCYQKTTNPPNAEDPYYNPARGGAWYCANYQEIDPANHTYKFPVLEGLFANAGGSHSNKAMGIQPAYTQTVRKDNKLEKKEGKSGITTTDTLNWAATTERKVIFVPYNYHGDPANYYPDSPEPEREGGKVVAKEVPANATVGQSKKKSWWTKW